MAFKINQIKFLSLLTLPIIYKIHRNQGISLEETRQTSRESKIFHKIRL